MSKDFLSMPESHHHVSRIIVLVLILAVIILVGWLYVVLFDSGWSGSESLSETLPPGELAEREAFLEKVRSENEGLAPVSDTEAARREAFVEKIRRDNNYQ